MPTLAIGFVTTIPSTVTAPAVAGRKPAMMRSKVDLPQPLGPTNETNSPCATSSEMSRNASTGPLAVW